MGITPRITSTADTSHSDATENDTDYIDAVHQQLFKMFVFKPA